LQHLPLCQVFSGPAFQSCLICPYNLASSHNCVPPGPRGGALGNRDGKVADRSQTSWWRRQRGSGLARRDEHFLSYLRRWSSFPEPLQENCVHYQICKSWTIYS